MATRKKENSFVKAIKNILSINTGNIDISKLGATQPKRIFSTANKAGRKRLLEEARTTVSTKTSVTTLEGLIGYSQSVTSQVATSAEENKRLIKIIPELNKAMQIVIASIISPNDLQRNKINIKIDNIDGLSQETISDINILLTDFFEDQLHLSANLPIWIKNSLYIYGSQPLLVLPTQSLSTLLSDYIKRESLTHLHSKLFYPNIGRENYQLSLDALSKKRQFGKIGSIESKYTNTNKAAELNTSNSSNIKFEREANWRVEQFLTTTIAAKKDKKPLKISSSEISSLSKKIVESMTSEKNIIITDNIDVVGVSQMINRINLEVTTATYRQDINRYEPAQILGIPEPTENDKIFGNPIQIILPPESVAVGFSPGLEANHLFYIILLDADGSPINYTNQSGFMGDMNYMSGSGIGSGTSFRELFNSIGGMGSIDSNKLDYNQIKALYQTILEDKLNEKSSTLGFVGASLGDNEQLFSNLFYRYLSQRQTRIVIVPKTLLSYLAFEYDDNGLGVSILEGSKFILGLRLNLLINRTISAIVNSIQKTKINLKFSENFHGDVDEMSALAENIFVKKNSGWMFSMDPNEVAEQRNRKSISIGVSGGQESADISGFTMEPEYINRPMTPVDDSLDAIIEKQFSTTLIVPDTAITQMNESDFAASVLTNNAFYTRVISIFQTTAVPTLNKHLINYGRYSSYLRQALLKCMSSASTAAEDTSSDKFQPTKHDRGSVDSSIDNTDSDATPINNDTQLLNKVLDSITIVLPKPEFIPSSGQLTKLGEMYTNITTYVDNIISDDLASADEASKVGIVYLKTLMKNQFCSSYALQAGISQEHIPNIFNLDFSKARELNQQLKNMFASFVAQNEAITGDAGETDMGGMNGGFGDDNNIDNFDTTGMTTGDSEMTSLQDDASADLSDAGGGDDEGGVKIL